MIQKKPLNDEINVGSVQCDQIFSVQCDQIVLFFIVRGKNNILQK